jgi:hypothetical protein
MTPGRKAAVAKQEPAQGCTASVRMSAALSAGTTAAVTVAAVVLWRLLT